jgi:hypothetical protein
MVKMRLVGRRFQMTVVDVEHPEPVGGEETFLEEGGVPFTPGVGRRTVVVFLSLLLTGATLIITLMAFARGSWWYSYDSDQPLNAAARVRVEAVRDEVRAASTAPEVVAWLEAALDPKTDPTGVRNYLITAYEALKASDDPQLVEVVRELQAIIQGIRLETVTPYPVPTLKGPWFPLKN